MAPEESLKSAKASKDELAVISNRLAIAMAKREALVKSWTASSSNSRPEKTQEELDAEDAALFRNEPPHLGVGAAIPAHFLVNEAERGNKALRAKMLTTKGLKASKARDTEEKAASAKRGMRGESSDEEEGRSSLGRAKKLNGRRNIVPVMAPQMEAGSDSKSDEESKHQIKAKKRKLEVKEKAPVQAFDKVSLSNKETTEIKKEDKALSGKTKKDKQPINESSQGGDGDGNVKPAEPVVNETKMTKVEPPNPVNGFLGDEKKSLAGLTKDDGMDAKERRRLKKKEKKKLKKLREAELAAKVQG
ncbi:hypothetical protein BKA65DRAFT_21675 [Rhexocercosporidium sp. MPI-PUGE-AT-0058]|nr:hypothetical protein BKA65DRAFT_21675 [Rhexocercosporidium sp. MPI-PUGE-AT-0058]